MKKQTEIKNLLAIGEYQEALVQLSMLVRDTTGDKISGPKQCAMHLTEYAAKRQEHFIVLTLDGAGQVINTHVVSKGLVNKCLVHPREVFYPAIKDQAASIVVAHNHPSGVLKFSPEDEEITIRLKQASDILGIPVLDHIVFGVRSGIVDYASWVETHGMI